MSYTEGVSIMLSLPAATDRDSSRELTESQLLLKQMVLNSVTAANTRRNYAKSLDDLFAFAVGRPLTRALLQEWKASMDSLAASTVNVKLAAARRLVSEARRNGLIGAEEASNLSDIPNVAQRGNRMGNWLTRDQAKELLRVPDRSTLKGKRDYAILALLVGCALRRRELAVLDIADVQQREGRWVIADLRGKGNRIRTVAVPLWVKSAIDAWRTEAELLEGRIFRAIAKNGRISRSSLSDWAVWAIVQQSAEQIGMKRLGAHDLRRTCAKLCRKSGGDLEQIKFLLGHSSIQTTERYLGSEQDNAVAVNDNLGL
jgi:integrase